MRTTSIRWPVFPAAPAPRSPPGSAPPAAAAPASPDHRREREVEVLPHLDARRLQRVAAGAPAPAPRPRSGSPAPARSLPCCRAKFARFSTTRAMRVVSWTMISARAGAPRSPAPARSSCAKLRIDDERVVDLVRHAAPPARPPPPAAPPASAAPPPPPPPSGPPPPRDPTGPRGTRRTRSRPTPAPHPPAASPPIPLPPRPAATSPGGIDRPPRPPPAAGSARGRGRGPPPPSPGGPGGARPRSSPGARCPACRERGRPWGASPPDGRAPGLRSGPATRRSGGT